MLYCDGVLYCIVMVVLSLCAGCGAMLCCVSDVLSCVCCLVCVVLDCGGDEDEYEYAGIRAQTHKQILD